MDQESILLESCLDSQDKKLEHLATQMRDLSQSVYSMGVTLKNSIEKITGFVKHQGMYINPLEKGRRRISGHDEGSFKVRLLELDQKLELLLNRNQEHGSNLMVEGENPPLKLCWKKGDEMMISCVKQQERESNLDEKVSRSGGDRHKRIKELLPLCSQTETKEITSDLEEETKESAEALLVLEDVVDEESPMDFQEELTDSSFTKGETQEVLDDFKEELMEGRPSKLLAELINPDRSTSCVAGNARQLFDENPEPNSLKGTTVLYDTWHIFGGLESPNSNYASSQFSYQRNLFTSTPKSPLDSHIGNHSDKMVQTRIFPKCLVLCSTHQLLAESWYTKFYEVGYILWGHKPPKPPDYTCSVMFHQFSHTIIVKPPEYANFYSAWYGLCDHQSSNPSKPPDSTMMFRSNMLTVGSNTTHGCQTESQNQGLHTHSHMINLYFKYIVLGFVCKLLQESCEPKLIGGDSLISGYEENRPCSIKIDLVEGKQIHGLVIEANLQNDKAEQFLRAKITEMYDDCLSMPAAVLDFYWWLINMEVLEGFFMIEKTIRIIDRFVLKKLSDNFTIPTYKHKGNTSNVVLEDLQMHIQCVLEVSRGAQGAAGMVSKLKYPVQFKEVEGHHRDALGTGFSDVSRGEFYDSYMKKRVERLREHFGFNKAVKENRMKAMRDNLERSSVEMKIKLSPWSAVRHDSVSSGRRCAKRFRSFNDRSAMKLDFGQLENDEDLSELKLMSNGICKGKKSLPIKNSSTTTLHTLGPRSSPKLALSSTKQRVSLMNQMHVTSTCGERSVDHLIIDCREEDEDAVMGVDERGRTKAFRLLALQYITSVAGQAFNLGLYYMKGLAHLICYTLKRLITYFILIEVAIFYGGITIKTLKDNLNGGKAKQLFTITQQKRFKADLKSCLRASIFFMRPVLIENMLG